MTLKLLFCLLWFSRQFKRRPQPRNQEKAETCKGGNGRIRKDRQEQRCVIRDQD